MSDLLRGLLGDLRDETAIVEETVRDLSTAQWNTETPSVGWSIGDQITHLAYFDEAATLAATDEHAFRVHAAELESHGIDFSDWIAREHRSMKPVDQYAWFESARRDLVVAMSGIDPKSRLPWYGPSMSPASCISARIMETWAHGQDIADALVRTYPQSMRLYHVAHLGVRTFSHSFRVHDLEIPDVSVRVDLEAPDHTRWTWGDPESQEAVTGQALDFCYVVTQRRHVSETELMVQGPVAAQWLKVAQAFAGPPTITQRLIKPPMAR